MSGIETRSVTLNLTLGARQADVNVNAVNTFRGPKGEKGDPGRDGSMGNLTVNGKAPDEYSAISLTAGDVGALPAGSTAEAVGALPVGGTAADSNKLGGTAANEYMLRKAVRRHTFAPGGAGDVDVISDSFASVRISTTENAGLREALGGVGSYAYVHTNYYGNVGANENRYQIAVSYNVTAANPPRMAVRVYNSSQGGWTSWRKVSFADELEAAFAAGVNA